MEIERDHYLAELVRHKGGDLVKIVTGIRRCGKSYLLFRIYKRHLLREGVDRKHIVEIALDQEKFAELCNPIALGRYVKERIVDDGKMNYVLIDEIQLAYKVKKPGVVLSDVAPEDQDLCYVTFYDVLNELRMMENVDVYVTGSNSKMLSSDIATNFRDRGHEIRMYPLSFAEYCRTVAKAGKDKQEMLDDYLTWGGLPQVVLEPDERAKELHLKTLCAKLFLKDIKERHRLNDDYVAGKVLDVLASAVGSLTNPNKLVKTLGSQMHVKTTNRTLQKYLGYFEDSFLFSRAERYDVRGRKHLDYPSKYYAVDLGLRNARVNFREVEDAHLMENAIYNELVRRGYSVDVGVVYRVERVDGKTEKKQYEIDFVVNLGRRKVYVQSTYAMDRPGQYERETRPLRLGGDFFRRIVVMRGYRRPTEDEDGIVHVGIIPFLLDESLLLGE